MEDAVHVVRHDHELIHPHMWEVAWNSQPELLRDQSGRVEANYARPDFAKQWRPSLRTDRHEVRAALTIVMTGKPNGSTADPAPKKPVGIGLHHGRDDTTTPVGRVPKRTPTGPFRCQQRPPPFCRGTAMP